jgi:hypothetical protein
MCTSLLFCLLLLPGLFPQQAMLYGTPPPCRLAQLSGVRQGAWLRPGRSTAWFSELFWWLENVNRDCSKLRRPQNGILVHYCCCVQQADANASAAHVVQLMVPPLVPPQASHIFPAGWVLCLGFYVQGDGATTQWVLLLLESWLRCVGVVVGLLDVTPSPPVACVPYILMLPLYTMFVGPYYSYYDCYCGCCAVCWKSAGQLM